ncbi:ABC transporter ATP-binding protein [Aquibium sp. A9E412]|uniref:ABC transporter ATP-binding protein n=1 Tax=Aquibium sp. A9E412 TaxID=2976767 RepID=UPI0025B0A2B5|nr:ABC transporter ATP-binding protein [Aquibium sp. A9E412]MDN2567472.1 ABC transporter ATP-binding protein [Aquibium sp. A9E412]
MPGAAVHISGLSKRYGDFKAVDDVSLSIEPGEFVTLLGLSGSGKTTTLMAVAGLIKPDKGTIRINDTDIVSLAPERRGLGVVFQNYALFPNMNVFDNIAFPLRMRKRSTQEIREAVGRVLEVVALEPFADRRITALSGGQQQRVALARALVFEPPVLLMDEPLGALDRSLRDQLQTEIKRIQREFGVTVIYVTHDQEEALALSDRIAVMSDGKIRQLGSPDEIYERPSSAFVAGFVGDSNRVAVRLGEARGELRVVKAEQAPELELLAGPAEGSASGAEALMIVRPEAIELSLERPQAERNAVEGQIEMREFLGASIRFTVSTPLGTMHVRKGRTVAAAALKPGATVWTSWRPSDGLIFPSAA